MKSENGVMHRNETLPAGGVKENGAAESGATGIVGENLKRRLALMAKINNRKRFLLENKASNQLLKKNTA
jgi:hypothetical protein